MDMEALIIVNPVAGKTKKRWAAIEPILQEMEHDCEIQFTQSRGHATVLAAQAQNVDIIGCVGGDGTLNEIVNGIMGRDITISVIPTGTANDFVKSAGLHTDYIQAARNLFSPEVRSVDVGALTYDGGKRRYFIEVAGMGFDGLVSKTTSQINKPKIGTIPYLLGVLKHMAAYKSIEVSLTIDEMSFDQKVMFVDVAIGKYVGSGMTIAPLAKMDDGLFDVIVVGNFGRIESLLRLPTLYRGTHLNNPRIGFFRGQHVELVSEESLSIHVEGEYIGQTPAVFDILPGMLKVAAPSCEAGH
jgi:YegS/Rv2252/BmrU family lipid kinase